MTGRLRIALVSEWLEGSDDEGIHNFARALLTCWQRQHSVLTIGAKLLPNRLFLSPRLCRLLIAERPDLIFYISASCARPGAFLRTLVLKTYVPAARTFVIALQPTTYHQLELRVLAALMPDGVFTQSPKALQALRELSCPVRFLPSGVDTRRFIPATMARKSELRRQYGIPEGAFVVLHVGHLHGGRNVQCLSQLANLRGVQALLVGSARFSGDIGLSQQLVQAGVRVIQEYLPAIEQLYQMADVYLFPTTSDMAAIAVPLSILEAMACNLPVITTRFGGLPMMFTEGNGFFFFDNEGQLPDLIARVKDLRPCATRMMVESYDWANVATTAVSLAALDNWGKPVGEILGSEGIQW